ncbi:hypothetical protein H5S09_03830 [Limosilactobacillus sp. STM2_1]|uniref:Uncharacterized protein n=1 Tax=Limosilactobacillus rudii TaxID=2759755 RepID=A0A7W3YNA1_9LACO|nr:hypothetical protein [Limosilactobacillus rudii]MBB1079043.1 hypothetical protein [Limosilactobacillus rudii]MBB1097082.1 hypothetical protein [Limosilactobacillus rudii]MCD7134049.1 hypothetical protein [Limosilactobacillus rudii]
MLLGYFTLLLFSSLLVLGFISINSKLDIYQNQFKGEKFYYLKLIFWDSFTLFSRLIIITLAILGIVENAKHFNIVSLAKLQSANLTAIGFLTTITFYFLSNFIFKIHVILGMDNTKKLSLNAELAKLFIEIASISATPTFFLWHNQLKLPNSNDDFLLLSLFVSDFALVFGVAMFIAILFIFAFRVLKFIPAWMLQPKSANFATLSPNHYDIDNLLESENTYKSKKKNYIDSMKATISNDPLTNKLQDISFKRTKSSRR